MKVWNFTGFSRRLLGFSRWNLGKFTAVFFFNHQAASRKCRQRNCTNWHWAIWRPVHGKTWNWCFLGSPWQKGQYSVSKSSGWQDQNKIATYAWSTCKTLILQSYVSQWRDIHTLSKLVFFQPLASTEKLQGLNKLTASWSSSFHYWNPRNAANLRNLHL